MERRLGEHMLGSGDVEEQNVCKAKGDFVRNPSYRPMRWHAWLE